MTDKIEWLKKFGILCGKLWVRIYYENKKKKVKKGKRND